MSWLYSSESWLLVLLSGTFTEDMGIYWFLLTGFAVTLCSVPLIIRFAYKQRLIYVPNKRSSHSQAVPALGGVAIFAGISMAILLFKYSGSFVSTKIFLVLFLVFITGLIDDLFELKAYVKLGIFILLASFLTLFTGLRIDIFSATLWDANFIPVLNFSVTVFLIVTVINAINLIDGIDGLAAMMGIFILSVLSWFFYQSGHAGYLVLSLPAVIALTAFSIFNLWGKSYKIFMGDSGSLLLGMIISVSLIRFLNIDKGSMPLNFSNSPAAVFALMIIPVFDMFLVSVKRLVSGRSPFTAGKDHIHHSYLRLGYSHMRISIMLVLFSAAVFLISEYTLSRQLFFLYVICITLAVAFIWFVPEIMLKKRANDSIPSQYLFKGSYSESPAETEIFSLEDEKIEEPVLAGES